MNVFKLVNWKSQKNALREVPEYNRVKQPNTLARLIE